jgi:hypothetical protein
LLEVLEDLVLRILRAEFFFEEKRDRARDDLIDVANFQKLMIPGIVVAEADDLLDLGEIQVDGALGLPGFFGLKFAEIQKKENMNMVFLENLQNLASGQNRTQRKLPENFWLRQVFLPIIKTFFCALNLNQI